MASSNGENNPERTDEHYLAPASSLAPHTYFSFKMAGLVLAFVCQIAHRQDAHPRAIRDIRHPDCPGHRGRASPILGVDRAVTRFVPTHPRRRPRRRRCRLRRTLLIRVVAIVVFGVACAAAFASGGESGAPQLIRESICETLFSRYSSPGCERGFQPRQRPKRKGPTGVPDMTPLDAGQEAWKASVRRRRPTKLVGSGRSKGSQHPAESSAGSRDPECKRCGIFG